MSRPRPRFWRSATARARPSCSTTSATSALSGEDQQAIRDYRAALCIFLDIGDRRSEAETLNGMAAAFADTGEHLAAVGYYEKALRSRPNWLSAMRRPPLTRHRRSSPRHEPVFRSSMTTVSR